MLGSAAGNTKVEVSDKRGAPSVHLRFGAFPLPSPCLASTTCNILLIDLLLPHAPTM